MLVVDAAEQDKKRYKSNNKRRNDWERNKALNASNIFGIL
jgi:hypothetical protein